MDYLAHLEGKREQTIKMHAEGTACLSGMFADSFGKKDWGYCCGMLHDIGKYSEAFQKRIRGNNNKQVDHSSAGAQLCWEKGGMYPIISYCIAGHHAGLPDYTRGHGSGSGYTLCERMKKKVEDMAKLLNISKLLDKFPDECSGGEKQRAAICRALVTDPKLIIADEPTGNLDSKNSHELLQILRKMNQEQSKTIVMVTHDPQIASYSSKLIYITDGKIVKELEKNNMSQKEYFYEIINITSKDAQMLFTD